MYQTIYDEITKTFLVCKQVEDNVLLFFPADKSNSDYAQFLVQAKLTDKQVKALTPDTWYDFPEGE